MTTWHSGPPPSRGRWPTRIHGGDSRHRAADDVLEIREPHMTAPQRPTAEVDILLNDGSILRDVTPQRDGTMWWGGSGCGERFIEPGYFTIIEAAVIAKQED